MNASIFVTKWQRIKSINCNRSRLIAAHCRNISRKSQQSFQLASSSTADIVHCTPARRVKLGVVFDIDGVLLRGRNVIPTAQKAIHKLEDSNIPFIYLTNGGCETEEQKAEKLKKSLGVEVKLYFLLKCEVISCTQRSATLVLGSYNTLREKVTIRLSAKFGRKRKKKFGQ